MPPCDYLEGKKAEMGNDALASQLFAQGRKAINNNDLEALKGAVQQLSQLPVDDQEQASKFGGTTLRLP